MPCPHYDIRIVKRSAGQSAVASAAYQSGEKLYCEYEMVMKDYSSKEEIVHTEILLPDNAPTEYLDRQILWNSAESVEKQWNSQLARRIVVAIPREVPTEEYPQLIRDYCNEQFVSKGMCCDFAIHDKGDGNPHAHILLTLRAIDENGKWLPKSRKIYDTDKTGNRIKLKSGRWKSHKENTVDWNDRGKAEVWRQGWADKCNQYLEANGRDERLDLRSYKRQGIEKAPTIHMGAAAWNLEKKGVQTGVGDLNRKIHSVNIKWEKLANEIAEMKELLSSLENQLSWQSTIEAQPVDPLIYNIALVFKMERPIEEDEQDLTKPSSADYKQAQIFVLEHNISSFDDMRHAIGGLEESINDIVNKTEKHKQRISEIDEMMKAYEDYKKYDPVFRQYQSIRWKRQKEKFYTLNKAAINGRSNALAVIKQTLGTTRIDIKKLLHEKEQHIKSIKILNKKYDSAHAKVERLRRIRKYIEPAMTKIEIERQSRQMKHQKQRTTYNKNDIAR